MSRDTSLGQESNSTCQKNSLGAAKTNPQQREAAKTILQQLGLILLEWLHGSFLSRNNVLWVGTTFCELEQHFYVLGKAILPGRSASLWKSPGVSETRLESRSGHLESPRVTSGDTQSQPEWSHLESPRATRSHMESPRMIQKHLRRQLE